MAALAQDLASLAATAAFILGTYGLLWGYFG